MRVMISHERVELRSLANPYLDLCLGSGGMTVRVGFYKGGLYVCAVHESKRAKHGPSIREEAELVAEAGQNNNNKCATATINVRSSET